MRGNRLISAMVASSLLCIGYPALTAQPAGPIDNLALASTITASSSNGSFVAANAGDGNQSTYWESANNAFPQWIQADLGASVPTNRVVLKLPIANWATRTETLTVQGSTNGTNFTDLVASAGYTFNPATSSTVTIDFGTTTVRVVRLNITANTGWPAGQLSSFEVYGTSGGSATLALNPASLQFADTDVNTNSDWQTVTVTNTGTAPATIQSVTATGDFTVTTTCGTTVAPGANCTATVTFHPSAGGARTGTLSIRSTAANANATAALSGTGVAATTTNLARGRSITQSSNTQNYAGANAVDGNPDTYWESANNAFPQWLQADLGANTTVSRVVLRLPPATAWAARTETVTVTDATTGAVLVASRPCAFDPATGNTVTLTFPAAPVRNLRVTVTANTGWPAGQLSELEVYSA
jgi:hypothetical protein